MVHVLLQSGREKSVLQRHPWVFTGALKQIQGSPAPGDIVKVCTKSDEFLAYGYYEGGSRIALRLIEWQADTEINHAWYLSKLQQAIHARSDILSPATNTCRLIFSEADYLPGLIVDKFDNYLAYQATGALFITQSHIIAPMLAQLTGCTGIVNKTDAELWQNIHGSYTPCLYGSMPQGPVPVTEDGIKYLVNIPEGQKSGFYCDQRDNRRLVAAYAPGARVLDCFSYSGGFTLHALKAGAAMVHSVDSSAHALQLLAENISLNNLQQAPHQAILKDVNKQLKTLAYEQAQYDLIILDPPKYAPTRGSLNNAARAYKDLNRRAMALLPPGGILATFSCSAAVDIITLKQIVAWAALDAGRQVQVIQQLCQPADHPVRLSFPEGEYLKGLILRVN